MRWDNYALYHNLFLLENLFLYMSLQNNHCLIWLERQWLPHPELAGWKAFIRYFISLDTRTQRACWPCTWLLYGFLKNQTVHDSQLRVQRGLSRSLMRLGFMLFRESTSMTFCINQKSRWNNFIHLWK